MINLLPPERSQSIRYGRMNAMLLRWIAGLGAATVVLIIIIIGGWLYINQQSNNLQDDINGAQSQLTAQNLPKVQKDADEISGDVKVINQILSREVRFSDLLKSIGQIMPAGAILNSLTLTSANGAIDLSANTTSYSTAAQIAVNLSDPKNGLFTKVDIISINCTSGSTAYNCSATFKALFSKSAQTSFLGVAKAAQ